MKNSRINSAVCEKVSDAFTLTKSKMLTRAINQGGGKAIYMDAFSGKILWVGDPFEFGYIYSPIQIYKTYKDLLTADLIAEVVNCSANVIVSLRVILESFKEQDPEAWIANPRNIENHNIDLKLALTNIKKAKIGIEKKVKELTK